MRDDLRILKYLRLSLDDEGDGESNSIKMQRELLDSFIKNKFSRDSVIVDEVIDDGFSGLSFSRPGITKVLELLMQRRFNCLIVKDFSRFGRDHIQVGHYLEHIFPAMNIRFIAVNDNYDSENYIGSANGIDVILKNLVYEMYSKDLSVKLRSAKRTVMKTGKYVAPSALYGYKKHEGSVIINEETAPVVRKIFERAKEGVKASQIARELNEMGIPSPAEYKRKNDIVQYAKPEGMKPVWLGHAINKILQDERYTGKMILGKYGRPTVGGVAKLKPKEEWIVIENSHEPIVSQTLFDEVAAKLPHKKNNCKEYKKHGIFKCGGCNRALMQGKNERMICRFHGMHLSDECIDYFIPKEELHSILNQIINTHFSIMVENARQLKQKANHESDAEKVNVNEKIAKCRRMRFEIYEQFKNESITLSEYEERRKAISEELSVLSQQAEEADANGKEFSEEQFHKAELILNYKAEEGFDEKFIDYFIKEVVVFRDKKIKVVWKFGLDDFLKKQP